MSIKGYPSQSKVQRVQPEFATIEPVSARQHALAVLARIFAYEVGTDAAEAASTTESIVATAHAALKGDLIRFTSGTLSGLEFRVHSVSANAIVPSEDMSVAPSAADTFTIYRHRIPTCTSDGALSVSTTIAGVATETTLAAMSAKLPATLGQKAMTASMAVVIASDQSAVPVSAASLPLPSGAATEAKQDTGNTSLTSIDGKLPALGQALAAASVPVVLTAAQISTLTPLSTVAATQSGTWNITNVSGTVSLPTGASTEATLSTLNGKVPSLGQALDAASVPVVLTAAQISTLTPLATVAATQSGTWSTRSQDGSGNALTSEAVGSNRPIHTKGQGLSYADSVQKASGTVTSGAWVQLIASTAAVAQALMIFDSSGYAWELGFGAVASEARKLIVPPGGFSGPIPLYIPAGTRLSARALSTTCDYTAAEMDMNLLG
jgi:hypothetical protein